MKIGNQLAAAVLGACLLVSGVAAHVTSTSASGPVPFTVVQDGTSVDPNHSLVGAQFDSPVGTASAASVTPISASAAVAAAEDNEPGLASTATGISAFYTLYTNTMYANKGSDGQMHPIFVKVPVWIVTFTGIYLPGTGGFPVPDLKTGVSPSPTAQLADHEMHVVINAVTGAYMIEYAYR